MRVTWVLEAVANSHPHLLTNTDVLLQHLSEFLKPEESQ